MTKGRHTSGYGLGRVDTVMSVDAVEEAAREMSGAGPDRDDLLALAGTEIAIDVEGLHAGYGRMEILHHLNLIAGKGQSLCLIGPNGAGKSTILHAIYGFADVMSGTITAGGADITKMSPSNKLRRARRRLHYAAQFGVPRHDGRRKPPDGRLSEGSSDGSPAGRNAGLRQVRPPRRPAPPARRCIVGAENGGYSKSHAH